MLTVHAVSPLLILPAILAVTSSSMSSNYGDLESMAASHSHRYENSGGRDRYATHEDEVGDRADEGSKSYHHLAEAKKGHHDLDKGNEHYDKEGGGMNHHGHNDGHYDEHHEGVEGGKDGGFREKGNYGKGQSTHGEHEVKQLDEYKKIKEFHEEDYDSDFDKHESGLHEEREQEKGGYYKSGILDHDEHKAEHDKKNHYSKGHHHRDHMGHIGNSDHEDHYQNDYDQGEKVWLDGGSLSGYKNDH